MKNKLLKLIAVLFAFPLLLLSSVKADIAVVPSISILPLDGIPTALLIGILIAGVVIVAVVAIAIILIVKSRKKTKKK